jgi:RNA-directed DNA polymerase
MAEPQGTGAASDTPTDPAGENLSPEEKNVRRLQARIVKATQAGRMGKARALQHLLTHSYSGKKLAVERVTSNAGSKTPGVDGET